MNAIKIERMLKLSACERAKAAMAELYSMQSIHLRFENDEIKAQAEARSAQMRKLMADFIEEFEGRSFHK